MIPDERAPTVRPGPSLTSDAAAPSEVQRVVDRVIEEHRLGSPFAREAARRAAILGTRFGAEGSVRTVETRTERVGDDVVTTSRTITQTSEGVLGAALDRELAASRRARDRLLEELRPTAMTVFLDPPMVTRDGVLYVPPRFEQAVVFGPAAEAKLHAAGFLTAESVIEAEPARLAAVTELREEDMVKGQRDLDLTRLAGIDRAGADLLRVAGIHCISRLAERDPAFLAREIVRLQDVHRLRSVPAALSDEASITRLIARAQELAR